MWVYCIQARPYTPIISYPTPMKMRNQTAYDLAVTRHVLASPGDVRALIDICDIFLQVCSMGGTRVFVWYACIRGH